ncbi:MAG: OmpA family protein [Rhodospirillaceae bacterium]|mgnify:FL=1|jgi:outer membrane protein OmpA-like peptidoglycan-associated protein|nr:OmpA family protein [Rhodospirillales bacterium]MBT4703114.1 OmpA family protein [Rhodospirillaceae bacterium]MBT5033374.1 OmpA family protein [Rhodospirillaceae bacterium]MBT6219218.1 OmpA family protein [Rhodospirillaceae bacterium]MBT6363927.1 OmpA family protein [Rhodospirillaceae bacterium]
MTNRRRIRCCVVSIVAIAVILGIGALQPAHAQSGVIGPIDPNVSIDMSVLEDGGVGAVTRPQSGLSFSTDVYGGPVDTIGTIMPSRRAPVSRLLIRPDGSTPSRMARGAAPKLRRPKVKFPKMVRKAKPRKAPRISAPAKSKPVIKAPAVVAVAPPPPPPPAPKPKPAPKPAKVVAAPVAAPPPPPAVETKPVEAAPPPPPPPPAPTPVKKVEAKPAPKPKQTASLPPKGGDIKAGKAIRVVFNPGASKLPNDAKDGLRAIAGKLKGAATLRLQLLAYAGGGSISSSKARRVSLSRALSVRSFLIESGVRSTRIDVRALGNKSTEKPINRVDVNVVER